MIKHVIKSIYNDSINELETGVNYWQTLKVYQPIEFGEIYIEKTVKYIETDENGIKTTYNDPVEIITINDPVWDLIYEDIEESYRAFHAYAVGHDGSHLTYMFITYGGTIEED